MVICNFYSWSYILAICAISCVTLNDFSICLFICQNDLETKHKPRAEQIGVYMVIKEVLANSIWNALWFP